MIENVTGQWIRRVYLIGELFRLPPIVHFSNKSLLPELTMRKIFNLAFALTVFASTASSQIAAKDGSSRLREVLPPDVAQRVIALIADARAQQLPADALENRALKFAAKGVDPKAIERSVGEQAERMAAARNSLAQGRQSPPAGDEIEAGAEAIRKGIDGQAISLLAKNAPAGRSLAVPLFVIGSLTDRGLPSDEALNRVLDRLKARASDADLESMPVSCRREFLQVRQRRMAQPGASSVRAITPPRAGQPPRGRRQGSRETPERKPTLVRVENRRSQTSKSSRGTAKPSRFFFPGDSNALAAQSPVEL